MTLHYNKALYCEIFEEIQNIEAQISNHKEMISNTKRDLVHIDFRIIQAQNKHTHEYIPAMVTIRKYLLHRQRMHQNQFERDLNLLSDLRKKISAG